ncbi:hypothetical protein Tco_0845336 [Tanacetum coccineum]
MKLPTKDSDKTQSVSLGQTAYPQNTERKIQLAVKGSHSPPDEGTRSSNSLPEGKPTDAKDLEGNIQPAGMGLSSTSLDEGTHKSQPLPEGKTTDPKDLEGNQHPADKGLPSTVPDKSIGKPKPLPEGPREDKDSKRLKPLTDMESQTPLVLSWTDAEYQVDKTQSTKFKVSVPDQHQSKTSSEVDLDFEPLKLTTIVYNQALMGSSDDDLKEDSKDDVFEVGEEIDEDIQDPDTE